MPFSCPAPCPNCVFWTEANGCMFPDEAPDCTPKDSQFQSRYDFVIVGDEGL